MPGLYSFGRLLDPRADDPTEPLLADAVQRAYETAKRDRKEAVCVWDVDGNEVFMFLNGQRWQLA